MPGRPCGRKTGDMAPASHPNLAAPEVLGSTVVASVAVICLVARLDGRPDVRARSES